MATYDGWTITLELGRLRGWSNGESLDDIDEQASCDAYDEALLADVKAAFPGAIVELGNKFGAYAPSYNPNDEQGVEESIEAVKGLGKLRVGTPNDVQGVEESIEAMAEHLMANETGRWMKPLA